MSKLELSDNSEYSEYSNNSEFSENLENSENCNELVFGWVCQSNIEGLKVGLKVV